MGFLKKLFEITEEKTENIEKKTNMNGIVSALLIPPGPIPQIKYIEVNIIKLLKN